VATWAWPTWVVSWRSVLETAFILLESPSPSRRIFIGSHSLPPLWFAVSILQCTPGNAYISKTLLGEEFTAAINGRYLKKYYPSIEVDRWLQAPGLQASDTKKQPAFGEEAAFRTKNPNRKWQILMCIALNTKIFHITDVSCRLLFDNPAT
jgi:hypothetical protein